MQKQMTKDGTHAHHVVVYLCMILHQQLQSGMYLYSEAASRSIDQQLRCTFICAIQRMTAAGPNKVKCKTARDIQASQRGIATPYGQYISTHQAALRFA